MKDSKRTVGVYDRPESSRLSRNGIGSGLWLIIAILIALIIAWFFFL